MKEIRIYPKLELLNTWAYDRTCFSPDTTKPPLCLRCGRRLDGCLAYNSKSRHADTYICSECGTDETLRDATGTPLPLASWDAVVSGRLKQPADNDAWVLTPTCSFPQVFQDTAKSPGSLERPISELVYSRSDYDGCKWWLTWHDCHREYKTPELAQEVDLFIAALFQMPEFQSLGTMEQMCRSYAEKTTERTEYNLYSETDSFYIWLRPITRFRDYNLYVHFYLKQS